MRFATSARAQFFTATALSLALIVGVLAIAAPTPGTQVEPTVEPEFFAFGDEPFADDLNHFLVVLEDAVSVEGEGPLRVDAGGAIEFADDAVPGAVAPEDLLAAINGDASSVDPAAFLARRDDVASVREVGFGIFAAAGSIELEALQRVPGVAHAEPDHGVATASADPLFPSQWGLENDGTTMEPWALLADADIDADAGWHRTRGAGVVVAVIDSGVDIAHPDLVNNIWHNPGETCGNNVDDDNNGYVDDCDGWDFVNNDNTPEDLNGHGTHVAGIIGAEANNAIGIAGVAYESQVMALKIGNEAPPLSTAIEAIGRMPSTTELVLSTPRG